MTNDDILIDADDFFADYARSNAEFTDGLLEDIAEQIEEGDYKTACGLLRLYVHGTEKLADLADFLNKTEEETEKLLDARAIDQKDHLEKILEFLTLE